MRLPDPRIFVPAPTPPSDELKLPKLPDNMEWVVQADPDRFTVSLSYRVPQDANPDEDKKATISQGYIKSHTHRHDCPISREEWEKEVCAAAQHLWTHYTEGNLYAQWADEIMRRSR